MIVSIKTIDLTEQRYHEIIDLYKDFTIIDKNILTIDKFKQIVNELSINHDIFFYIHENKIIGAITLLIEQKLIHDGKCVGHLEDYIISINHRKNGYGVKLLDHVTKIALINNCYKCILDCSTDLEDYYINNKFIKKGIYMAKYF